MLKQTTGVAMHNHEDFVIKTFDQNIKLNDGHMIKKNLQIVSQI